LSSLSHCLELHTNLFSDEEKNQVRNAAAEYRKEGFDAQIANVSAVEDIIRDLEQERADIVKQATGKKPPIKPEVPPKPEVSAIEAEIAETPIEEIERMIEEAAPEEIAPVEEAAAPAVAEEGAAPVPPTAPKPPTEKPAVPKASDIAKKAAKAGVQGVDEAITGLYELFGGKGVVRTFPGAIDEKTYAAAKPHFEAALAKWKEAGKNLKDLVQFLVNNFGNGIKPYISRWMRELKGITEIEEAEGAKAPTLEEAVGEEEKGKKEKKKVKKLKDVGERRWKRAGMSTEDRIEKITLELDKEITETDTKKVLAALQRMTVKATLIPTNELSKDATPGLIRWFNAMRRDIVGFTEWAGKKFGGRKGWGKSYEDAIQEALSGPTGKEEVRKMAAKYIATLEQLAEAITSGTTISQARDALIRLMVDESNYEIRKLDNIVNFYDLSSGTLDGILTEWGQSYTDIVKYSLFIMQKNILTKWTDRLIEKENDEEKNLKIVRERRKIFDIETDGAERKGKNVTGQDLIDTFGLGTVAFGNWTEGPHRQKSVNLTFDSLYDLVKILGAPAKAASYNMERRLGIMYGARGRGGRAAATFHPEDNTINLTKTHGDGSLAHEWGHGFDFYSKVSMKNNENEEYRSYNPFDDLKHAFKFKYDLSSMMQTVEDLLRGIHYTSRKGRNRLKEAENWIKDKWESEFVSKTRFWTDAIGLDGGKQGKYWSQPVEMFARAFEAYVADNLEKENYYLVDPAFVASGAVEELFRREHGAYPTEEERDRFNELFKAFFDGMTWDENGVPTMKPDYVPVTLQEYLSAKENVQKVLDTLEDIYKALYAGKQSEDGLYWYAYRDTTRAPEMQPQGVMAFDDEYRQEGFTGQGAIGYGESVHPDDVIKYGLEPIVHEKTDKTQYLEVGEDGTVISDWTTGGAALGESSARDGETFKEGGGVSTGTDRGAGVGEEGAGGPGVEEGGELPGGEGVTDDGADLPTTGDGTEDTSEVSDAVQSAGRIDHTVLTTDNLDQRSIAQRFTDNISAIRLLKRIEEEDRLATPQEQKVLAKFSGWGALSPALEHYPPEAWQSRANMVAEVLTNEELEAARRSTIDAYYTPVAVYDAIYRTLAKFGFTPGRILSPSVGIGLEFGTMPDELRKISSLTGIEMDNISARIAKQLYQNQSIINDRFENVSMPENFYDLVISNVPFGDSQPHDRTHNPFRFRIHDYFINKSLNLTRPGGLMAIITSTGTMDKANAKARQIFSEEAELVGAIRLPNGTFVGAEAACDICFFRKRGDNLTPIPDNPFVETVREKLPYLNKDGTIRETTWKAERDINQYFKDHPEMVLGTMGVQMGRYGEQVVTIGDNTNVGEKIDEATKKLPDGVYTEIQVNHELNLLENMPKAGDIKDGAYYVGQDGKLYINDGGTPIEYEERTPTQKDRAKRIRALIPIRDTIRELLRGHIAEVSKDELEKFRKILNTQYDNFVKKFGWINSRKNVMAIFDDPDAGVLLALEKWDEIEETSKGKEAIFSENYIAKVKPPESVEDITEALVYSLNYKGRVDLGFISQLTGASRDDVVARLKGKIYNDPERGYVTADEYLSGNVKRKLKTAIQAARTDEKFQENVDALQMIQPEDIPIHDIKIRIGAAWMPIKHIRNFMLDMMEGTVRNFKIDHVPDIGKFNIVWTGPSNAAANRNRQAGESSYHATDTWGTRDVNFFKLMDYILNGGFPKVWRRDAYGNKWFDQAATDTAIYKMSQIHDRFQSWVAETEGVQDDMKEIYNARYNAHVDRVFDGSHLTMPGKVPDAIIKLRPHQKNAIWRFLQTGVAYFGHEVGTGKTFTLLGCAMEARRLGLAKKPVISIKKATINDFKTAFQQLYPAAKVLFLHVPGNKAKRIKTLSKIATGDYDAIVVTHESFEKIPLSPEGYAQTIRADVRKLEAALLEAQRQGAGRVTIRDLENAKQKLEDRLSEILEKERDNIPTFEELGIDLILIDEAHDYKNLYFTTNYENVKGIKSGEVVKRSMDLYAKTNYMHKRFGRGIVFASGTPLTNSVGELFTLSRYLQPNELKFRGIETFEPWANTFGIISSEAEPNPTGRGFKMVTRFDRFINIPELMQMVRGVFDIIRVGDKDKTGMIKIPRPDIAGDKPQNIIVPQNPQVAEYQDELMARALAIKADPMHAEWHGKRDIMLRIITDGRKMAIDPRLVEQQRQDEEDTKVNAALEKILDIYKKSYPAYDWDKNEDYTETKGVQLIFLDLGVPGGAIPHSPYTDLIDKLVKNGVPRNEIATIHQIPYGPKGETMRKKLFAKVRAGEIRIFMGSTPKMGIGVNIQTRVVAMHHLDVDWNYANYEQRNGRGIRYGNNIKEVQIYNYGTEATVDAFMWNTVATKSMVLGQIMSLNPSIRELEDISRDTMNAQEYVSELSGDPLIKEQLELTKEVRVLRNAKADFDRNKMRSRSRLANLPKIIEGKKDEVEAWQKKFDRFSQIKAIQIGEEFYDLEKEGGKANDATDKFIKDKTVIRALKGDIESRKTIGRFGYIETEEVPYIEEKEVKKKDKDGKPILDKEGKPVTEIQKIEKTKKVKKFVPLAPHLRLMYSVFQASPMFEFSATAMGGDTATFKPENGVKHVVTRVVTGIQNLIDETNAEIDKFEKEIPIIEAKVDAKFDKQEELVTKEARLHTVTQELLERQQLEEQAVRQGRHGGPTLPGGDTVLSAQGIEEVEEGTVRNIATVARNVSNALRNALPPEVLNRITIELSPWLELEDYFKSGAAKKSLEEAGIKEGQKYRIYGATSFTDKMEAIVRIAFNHDRSPEYTAYHEALHVAMRWLLPQAEYDRLLKYFKGNEENAAEAFAGFAMKRKGAELKGFPGYVRGLFLKIKSLLVKIRSALQKKGFTDPEAIFENIMIGRYKPLTESETRARTEEAILSTKPPPDPVKERAQAYIDAINQMAKQKNASEATKAKAARIKREQDYFDQGGFVQDVGDIFKSVKSVMNKRVDDFRQKPDTAWFQRMFQTPEFYFEEIDAAKRVYDAALERPDDLKTQYNDITDHDNHIVKIKKLKKERKEEYKKLKRFITWADRNKFVATNEDLKKAKFSDQAIDAWRAYRKIMDNAWIKLHTDMVNLLAKYESKGMKPPDIVVWEGDKRVKINLRMALARMGDMRGYYAPRIRKSGRFTLVARKDGTNPWLIMGDSKKLLQARGVGFEKRGYKVKIGKTRQLSEDVFEYGARTLDLQNIINAALGDITKENIGLSFDQFNLNGYRETRPGGANYFVVRGPTTKKMNEVFKAFGGRHYSFPKGTANAWHFSDPSADFEVKLLKSLAAQAGIPGATEADMLFAYALATQVANLVKERGFRQHMVKRAATVTEEDVWLGYEEDPLLAASQYASNVSAGIAKRNMASKMVRAISGTDLGPEEYDSFEDYLEGVKERRIDAIEQPNIYRDVKSYMIEMLRNEEFSDRVIGYVKGLAVLKYLGFRGSSALVNLTALATSVPSSMNTYANIDLKDVPKYLVMGINASLKYRKHLKGERTDLDDDTIKMFDTLYTKGWDEAQYNMEAISVLRSRLGGGYDSIINGAMLMFGQTERLNRIATIAGTYLGARDTGMGYDEAVEVAKKTSDRSHGVYGKKTLPYLAQGKNPFAQIAKMFYVFSKFSHTYLQNMYTIGFKEHNKKGLLYMMLAPAILGGAGAMPIIGKPLIAVLGQILSELRGDEDEWEEGFYSWVFDLFGDNAEKFARYGLPGFAGISLRGSLQIDFIGNFPMKIPELLGAPGNVLVDMYEGGKMIYEGQTYRGIEKIAPRAISSAMQGYREAKYGVTSQRQTPITYEDKQIWPDMIDTIMRIANFNPSGISRLKEKKWARTKQIRHYRDKRSDLYTRVKAFYQKPQGRRSEREWADILADINDYNETIKTKKLLGIQGISEITHKTLKQSIRAKQ